MRLDTRPSQWLGALFIAAWAALLAFGLPRVAAAIPSETATVAGEAVTVGGVTLTPADGWTLSADSKAILVLRKNGAQITALPPQPAAGDASALLKPIVDIQRADANTNWQIGEEQPFTTAGGGTGAWVVALAPSQFAATFAVIEGDRSSLVTVTGTDTAWTTLKDEILRTLGTLELNGAGS